MSDQPDTIVLTPNWEALCRWFARGLADHSFDRGARAPVRSLVEIVRYLSFADPDALRRVLDELQ